MFLSRRRIRLTRLCACSPRLPRVWPHLQPGLEREPASQASQAIAAADVVVGMRLRIIYFIFGSISIEGHRAARKRLDHQPHYTTIDGLLMRVMARTFEACLLFAFRATRYFIHPLHPFFCGTCCFRITDSALPLARTLIARISHSTRHSFFIFHTR